MKIDLRRMKKSFGKRILFENFNILIEPGDLICISGKSGSGKTTLLNILGLIESMDAGVLLYNDGAIDTPQKRRKLLSETVGFIFQNYGLIDNESVYNNLALLKKMRFLSKGRKIEQIEKVLAQVGLGRDYIHKKIYECSGGEQQRIAIARVLLKGSNVVFADEPTASLDTDNKLVILNHLKTLNGLGKTIVIVSHDNEVCSFCNRVVEI